MLRRTTRSLTIALSRGHDERVRFIDLMFKRHIIYGILLFFNIIISYYINIFLFVNVGAYWRLGDLENLYDKFTDEQVAAMQELLFPTKAILDPLLIASIYFIFCLFYYNFCNLYDQFRNCRFQS